MVLEELDSEGEFFYSDFDRKLYIKPNTTRTSKVGDDKVGGMGSIRWKGIDKVEGDR
jgi:hypothetical protein